MRGRILRTVFFVKFILFTTGAFPVLKGPVTGFNYQLTQNAALFNYHKTATDQPPVISYPTIPLWIANTPINALQPYNSGGSVPQTIYGQVTTFAGNGSSAYQDGNAASASFFTPNAAAIDINGNLYIADQNNNVIRKITPSGVVSTLAGSGNAGFTNASGSAASFNQPQGVAVDASGNVYVADSKNHVIRKVDPSGKVSTFAGNGLAGRADGTGTNASFDTPYGIAIDPNGNVLVTDWNNTIRRITPAGVVTTFAGNGVSGANDGPALTATFNQPSGIAVDASGNVFIADKNNKRIRKIDSNGIVSNLVGNKYGSWGGSLIDVSLGDPIGVAIDIGGNLYISDSNNVILEVSSSGSVNLLAGSGGLNGQDGIGKKASFNNPTGLAVDVSGNLYVADSGNNLIRKVVTTGYSISQELPIGLSLDSRTGVISGNPLGPYPSQPFIVTAHNIYGNGYATIVIKINSNQKVTFPPLQIKLNTDPDFDPGIVYSDGLNEPLMSTNTNVAEITQDRLIHIVDIGRTTIYTYQVGPEAGQFIQISQELIVVPGGGVQVTTPTVAVSKQSGPFDFQLDQSGKINLSLNDLATVNSSNPANTQVNISPSQFDCSTQGTQMVTVKATTYGGISTYQASFNYPSNMVQDSKGNYYISDTFNSLIRKLAPDGTVSTYAGSYSGYQDGNIRQATFNYPVGMVIDRSDNIYIADRGNKRIRKITPDGQVSTFAGNASADVVDGIGTSASFFSPTGLTLDKNGDLYLTDFGFIRKITPDARVTTLAGNMEPGYQDGQGNNAKFSWLGGIAIDNNGDIFVADEGNNLIRKMTQSGIVSTYTGMYSNSVANIDGPLSTAMFNGPRSLIFGPDGSLYVGESAGRIRKIGRDGIVTTIAGFNHPTKLLDGPAATATLGEVMGFLFDNAGNLFFTQYTMIRKLSPEGIVKTVAGNGEFGAQNGNVFEGASVADSVKIAVNIKGTFAFETPMNDVSITVNSSCPTMLPDYTKGIKIKDNCSTNIKLTQAPAPGTVITGTDPVIVTITAKDDMKGEINTSFKVTPDSKPAPPISIVISSTASTICSGEKISFSANAQNAGTNPSYQWMLNGKPVGGNTANYSNNALKDKDIVNCVVTNTSSCMNFTTSNSISLQVNEYISPSVTISATPGSICSGNKITFHASSANSGNNPSYQWQLNGVNIGDGNVEYSIDNLSNGDKVTCIVSNNDNSCLVSRTAVSNTFTAQVSPIIYPYIQISTSAPNLVCAGTKISFSVNKTNVLNTAYQWLVNGNSIGTNNAVFSSSELKDGDIISCVMTTTDKCTTASSVVSNAIPVHILQPTSLSVTINQQSDAYCYGDPITLTAQVSENIPDLLFQWQINGINRGENSPVFASNTLRDGDIVTCSVKAVTSCTLPATSLPIVLKINPLPTISYNIAPVIKKGTSVKLNPMVKGNILSYKWEPATGLSSTDVVDPIAKPLVTTTYSFTAVSTSGCQTTIPVTVSVVQPIDIPNTFTPNGDGINDQWNIESLHYYPNCSVKIYSRYGSLLYQSRGYDNPWDGTANGKSLPSGTYYYIISINNDTPPLSGYVAIIN